MHCLNNLPIKYKYKTRPYDHQREALKWLNKQPDFGALLMDPGLGKTKVVIDYLGIRRLKHGPERWLIIAPKVALPVWQAEFNTHCAVDSLPTPVVLHGTILERAKKLREAPEACIFLTTHETFSSTRKLKETKTVTEADRLLQAFQNNHFTGIVIDESHRVKGKNAKRTRLLSRIAQNVDFMILMTGTPAPNTPADIWGQWSVMNPRRFGSWTDFSDTYITWGGYHNKQMIAFKHLDELQQLLQLDSFVARKDECLDLPPVTHQVIPVALSKKESTIYAKMAQEFVVQLEDGSWVLADNGLVKMLRLRQITSGFLEDKVIGTSKLETCFELVKDLVEQGEKVVIFAHFIADIKALETTQAVLGVPIHVIHGGTTSEKRQSQLTFFKEQTGPQIIIGQMRSLGISINELVVSSNAIFYSLSERREDWVQAKDRLDRNGQTHPVVCRYLLAERTIDEAMWKAYNEKQRLEDILLANPNCYLGAR